MNQMPLNDRAVTVNMTRLELCDLLLACSNMVYLLTQNGGNADKWHALHVHLRDELERFDQEQGY